jgi:hypothetical protein
MGLNFKYILSSKYIVRILLAFLAEAKLESLRPLRMRACGDHVAKLGEAPLAPCGVIGAVIRVAIGLLMLRGWMQRKQETGNWIRYEDQQD